MDAVFFGKDAARIVFSGRVCSGSTPPSHKATPLSSSPSSSAAPASCPSFLPYLKIKDLVSN